MLDRDEKHVANDLGSFQAQASDPGTKSLRVYKKGERQQYHEDQGKGGLFKD